MLHEVHTACCAPWCHPVWGLGGVSSRGWSPQLPHPVLWQNSPWASLLGSQGSPEKQNQWEIYFHRFIERRLSTQLWGLMKQV